MISPSVPSRVMWNSWSGPIAAPVVLIAACVFGSRFLSASVGRNFKQPRTFESANRAPSSTASVNWSSRSFETTFQSFSSSRPLSIAICASKRSI